MAEMSPLRRRMIEDMKIRNLSPATQRCYVHAVAKFSRYFKRSPDGLGLAEVRAYQVHLVSGGVSWDGFNQTVCALRFFYGVTLGRSAMVERIPYARKLPHLPIVLSTDEVARFLAGVPNLKHRMALTGLIQRSFLLWRAYSTRRPGGLQPYLGRAPAPRLGRLYQTSLRRPRAGAVLPWPLHPPRRHRQQQADRACRWASQLPLERLSPPRQIQGDDAYRRRIHPPFSASHPTGRFPSHPPLRLSRQRTPRRQAHPLSPTTSRPTGGYSTGPADRLSSKIPPTDRTLA